MSTTYDSDSSHSIHPESFLKAHLGTLHLISPVVVDSTWLLEMSDWLLLEGRQLLDEARRRGADAVKEDESPDLFYLRHTGLLAIAARRLRLRERLFELLADGKNNVTTRESEQQGKDAVPILEEPPSSGHSSCCDEDLRVELLNQHVRQVEVELRTMLEQIERRVTDVEKKVDALLQKRKMSVDSRSDDDDAFLLVDSSMLQRNDRTNQYRKVSLGPIGKTSVES